MRYFIIFFEGVEPAKNIIKYLIILSLLELSQRYDVIQEFMPIEIRKQGEKNRQMSDEVFDPVIGFPANVYETKGDSNLDRHEDLFYDPASEFVEAHIELTQKLYQTLIEAGVARECARRILPMCAKTVVHMTGNLRDFLAYINVRAEKGTQKEHREIALAIGKALEKEFPKFKETFPEWEKGGFLS